MKKIISSASILLGIAALATGVWGVVQKSSLGVLALLQFDIVPPEGVTGVPAFFYRYGLLTVVAGVLLLVLGVLLFLSGNEEDLEENDNDPSVMPDRTIIKSRVRGLLYKAWGGSLLASLYTALPWLVALVLSVLLFNPFTQLWQGVTLAYAALFEGVDTTLAFITGLLAFQFSPLPFLYALPGLGVLLLTGLFAVGPLKVGLSRFFFRKIRGKKPQAAEVFQVFPMVYGRALGGMLYRVLWLVVWLVSAGAVPVLLVKGAIFAIETFPDFCELLGPMGQLYFIGGVAGFAAVWGIVFACLWVNRYLAYSLTPCVLAAQPKLPARQAVRLSRQLMRGQKWQLIGLYVSFLQYYLPTLIAGLFWLALLLASKLVALGDVLMLGLRIFLIAVIAINQLIIVYVIPLSKACFHAFYLDRRRTALASGDIEPEALGTGEPSMNGSPSQKSVFMKQTSDGQPSQDQPTKKW